MLANVNQRKIDFFALVFQKVLVLAYEGFYKNYYTKINLHVHNYVLEIKIHVHFKNTILYETCEAVHMKCIYIFHIGFFEQRNQKHNTLLNSGGGGGEVCKENIIEIDGYYTCKISLLKDNVNIIIYLIQSPILHNVYIIIGIHKT